jgi:hypothetical protein
MDIESKKRAVRYHHLAIPTHDVMAGERQVPSFGYSHVSGTTNAYGIEWIRFHDDSPFPEMIKTRPHVAFEVDDLDEMLGGESLVFGPYQEHPGVRAAYIDVLDIPVKLMQVDPGAAGVLVGRPTDARTGRLKYHHTGIPGTATWDREIKVPHLKLAYLPGKYNAYGVEWLRFEPGNPNPDIIKYIPHVAFEVPDMDVALEGEKVVYGPNRETPGIAVSMIEVSGATVEFIELDRSIVGDQFDN